MSKVRDMRPFGHTLTLRWLKYALILLRLLENKSRRDLEVTIKLWRGGLVFVLNTNRTRTEGQGLGLSLTPEKLTDFL